MSEKIIITSAHEQPTTTSLNVAKVFDKQHKNILRDIEKILTSSNLSSLKDRDIEKILTAPNLGSENKNDSQIDSSPNLGALTTSNLRALKEWFFESTYIDKKGEARKSYEMTKDGFMLLSMGFTGEKALALKIAYIEQFNAMEKELQDREKNTQYRIKCRNFILINGKEFTKEGFSPLNERIDKYMIFNKYIDFIHEVKNRVTIREVIEYYGFKPNRAHKICCPFHGEKTPSLHIYEKTDTFHCFGCGIGGDAVRFVAELYKLNQYEAARKINTDMTLSVKEPDSSRSAPAPDAEKQKKEEEIFSIWCELKDIEAACINAFDELSEDDNGDNLQKDLDNIRSFKAIAEKFGKYGEDEDYKMLIEELSTIEELKQHYIIQKEEISMQENKNDITEEQEQGGFLTRYIESYEKFDESTKKYLDSQLTATAIQAENKIPYWCIVTEKNNEKKYNVNAELLAKYIQDTENYIFVQRRDTDDLRAFWYENGVYKRITASGIQGKIKDIIISKTGKTALAKYNKIYDTYRLIALPSAKDKHFVQSESLLDADENIINFQNGIYHFDTNTMTEHSPGLLSTIQIPCRYNPEVKTSLQDCPSAEKYLNHLGNNDSDSVRTLWETLGFTISNFKIEHFKAAVFLIGAGDSGKTTFGKFIKLIIGEDNFTALPFSELDKRFGTSVLYHKRVAIDDDCSYTSFSNVSVFKSITGGGEIKNEEKGKQSYSYVYNGLYIVLSNSLPLFSGDKGQHVYDRIIPIRTGDSVPKEQQDSHLLDKLLAEREVIINHALNIFRSCTIETNKMKFVLSQESLNLRRQYEIENDVTYQFLEECIDKSKTNSHETTTADLFKAFCYWLDDNAIRNKPTKKQFVTSICNYLNVPYNLKDSAIMKSNGRKYYKGLNLSDEAKKELIPYAK